MTTYAVTGSTGHFGRNAIDDLLERGVPAGDIVAIARSAEKAAPLTDRGVSVRIADYDRPETLAAALAGVDALLLVSASEIGKRVPQHAAVIDAAKAAGVGRIVYTSILKADTTRIGLAPEHAETERLLRASGIPSTFMRNSWYTENYTGQLDSYLASGAIATASQGVPVAGATRADYAAAAVTALLDPAHGEAVYELGGTPFTMEQLAAAITQATGRQVVASEVSADEYQGILEGAGVPAEFAAMYRGFEEATALGDLDTDSTDLADLLGRAPTPLLDAVRAAA